MKSIIDIILDHSEYEKKCLDIPAISFYKKTNPNIANYIIIYDVDCSSYENDEHKIKESLDELEAMYSLDKNVDGESLKVKIQSLFDNNQEASQIDKNTSAIYLLKFNDSERFNSMRNLIYTIEESSNYFKRYILAYTDKQVQMLNDKISDYEEKNIEQILSDIADNKDEYYKLMNGMNSGSLYELVIRLFSKIPFLKYDFKVNSMPISIEADIDNRMPNALKNCDNVLKNIKEDEIEEKTILTMLDDYIIDDEEIEKELETLLKADN